MHLLRPFSCRYWSLVSDYALSSTMLHLYPAVDFVKDIIFGESFCGKSPRGFNASRAFFARSPRDRESFLFQGSPVRCAYLLKDYRLFLRGVRRECGRTDVPSLREYPLTWTSPPLKSTVNFPSANNCHTKRRTVFNMSTPSCKCKSGGQGIHRHSDSFFRCFDSNCCH